MITFSISRGHLSEIILTNNYNIDKIKALLKNKFENLKTNDLEKVIEDIQRYFIYQLKTKWQKSQRKYDRFKKENSNWLNDMFTVQLEEVDSDLEKEPPAKKKVERSKKPFEEVDSNLKKEPPAKKKVGRPKKPFEECCDRAKRYKAKHLRETFTIEQLTLAAKNVSDTDITREYIDTNQTLAMITDADLSKYQYEVIRETLKRSGFDILPTYKKVLEAKKECYPREITVTETKAEIGLQNLLDHTVERMFKSFDTKTIENINKEELILISKWGCDGASGQNEFKQKFSDDSMNISDAFMYMASTVPIQLVSNDDIKKQFWQNSRPSSPRLCRTIQFEFAKETSELINSTVKYIQENISNLHKTTINISGRTFKVKHNMLCTMIDGKTAQSLTDTKSSSICYICKATPREMNDLDKIHQKSYSDNALKLGLSPLHARIKFMECILHIAYNLSFKKWSATKETKIEKEKNKKKIQEEFRSRTGLRIDMVRQGCGNTNDGNTSRRFFSQPKLTAEITGINEDLIKRFSVILEVVTCGAAIDPKKFGIYSYDTAKMFVDLYGWYYMPVTVHKVLLHGEQIISAALLPIGLLSEEAQEARNKDYKKHRIYHSRKISRITTNKNCISY